MKFKALLLLIILTLASAFKCRSQCISGNLIMNPNLEDYYHCPNSVMLIDYAKYWMQPLVSGSTSEYLNTCGIHCQCHPCYLIFNMHILEMVMQEF